MNAAVRAVVRSGLYHGLEVYAIQRGYQGLLEGEIRRMDVRSVGDIIQRGGTILRTARSKEFMTPEGRRKAVDMLERHGIEGLVVIGGDGSYRGAYELSKMGIRTVTIPGTIDNDIAYTDFTIGFDTAVSIVVDAANKLRDTMTSHERMSVMEVMGRHSGYIALYAGIASGAEAILVPEVPFDLERIAERIKSNLASGKRHSIVIAAEGVGRGTDIAQRLQELSGMEARVTVLGHIQRGGSPTPVDRILASRLGDFAVSRLLAGDTAKACGVIRGELVATDIELVVNTKKPFDYELYELSLRLSQ
jgi:6-phosphofructokinase 1